MPKALSARSPQIARSRQLVTVSDLTGGLDLRRAQTLMAPNRDRQCVNFQLTEPGALGVRPGWRVASTASLGSARGQGGERVYLANAVFSLVAFGGAVYKPSDAWVWGSPVYSTISATNQVYFPYDRDLVMVMDGANRPRFSTNGTTWSLAGTDAPSSAATLSTTTVGALSSGEYEFAYTYKHRGTAHESNASPVSTVTLTASTGAINVTVSPSTDAKNDAFVVYARHKTPDGESVLRRASSGGISTLTLKIISSGWTTNDEVPTNHNVPPTGLQYGTSWKSRWWAPSGIVGNRLHFTELFQPQAWPTLFYIDIPFEKGDSISAIKAVGDTLEVYGQSGVYLVIGQTSLDFEVRPSQGAESGSVGPRAVARVEQAVIHANGDGVHSYDGGADRSLEYDIAAAWRDLVGNTASTTLSLIASVYDQQRHELRIAVPRTYGSTTRGEYILALDRMRDNDGTPAWVTTDRDVAFYMHWNGNEATAGNRGRLFTMPSTGGVVNEENTGTTANGADMMAFYEGPGLSFGLHRARVTQAHIEYQPADGAASIEPVVDGVSLGSIAFPIGAGLAVVGAAVVGTSLLGGTGRRKAYTPLPLAASGRTLVTKLSYRGQGDFRIYTYAYAIQPESIPIQVSE